MKSIVKFVLITSMRDYLIHSLLFMIVAVSLMSVFFGGTALSEQREMMLSYIGFSNRIILVLGMIVFVAFHIRRIFDNKEIEIMLSRPISRIYFIYSYFVAFAIISLIIVTPTFIILTIYAKHNFVGVIYWCLSLVVELILISSFALATAVIMNNVVSSILSTLAFYTIGRTMGFIATMIEFDMSLPKLSYSLHWLGNFIVKITSILIPRLDLFSDTSWLVYGMKNVNCLWIIPAQFVVYILLMLAITNFDFSRKQF